VAGSLVVEIEKCRTLQERIDLYQKANAELERQVELLEKIVDLKDREIEVLERTNSKYRDLLTTEEEMYGQILKAQRPNPIQKAIEALGFVGLGVILVLLL
jgi:cell shape-determining protein MreC